MFTAELIKVMYERDAKCPDCRYSLNGLVGHRCPECGRSVEEFLRVVDTMPRRWAMVRRQMLDRRVRAVVVVLILAIISFSIAFAVVNLA